MKIATENLTPAFKPFKLVIEVENVDEIMDLAALCAVADTPAAAHAMGWATRSRVGALAHRISNALSQREGA